MDSKDAVDLLEKNGCRGVFIPFDRLDEVKEEIRRLRREGMLDKSFYDEWMPTYLDAKLPRSMSKPKSILLIAVPATQRKVTFHFNEKAHQFVVPPTYGIGTRITRRLRNILKDGQRNGSFRLVAAFPPLKLLAVRSGLARYGRNNVTYVPGFGSFHRLMAFYSDLEAPEGHWGEKRVHPKCAKCGACVSACPTGAISEDRFLLRAERCLPFMNERTSEHPFPSWVKPEWHNAIVGCMICQRVCPIDRGVIGKIEDGESFSEEETEYLLKGKYSGKKATLIRKKLKRAGLDMSIFPRNLETLLNRPGSN